MSVNGSQDHVAWKGDWQTAVPDSLLHSSMTGLAKLMWICLKSYASKTSPNPFPGRFTICQMMGIGINTFKKYRRELEVNGWLQRENRRLENGDFGGSVYTIMVSENCKQNPPPGVKIWPPINRPVNKWSAKNEPPKITSLEDHQKEKETTTRRDACASESGSGDLASQRATPSEASQGAEVFIKRWCECYQKWFGLPYRPSKKDKSSAEDVFRTFKRARLRDLLYIAFQMWDLTREKEDILPEGKDPLWFNFKAQKSVDFFCRHLEKVIAEQNDNPENVFGKITAKDREELEEVISAGRGN